MFVLLSFLYLENLTAGATTGIVTGVLVLVGLLVAGSVYLVKIIKARRTSVIIIFLRFNLHGDYGTSVLIIFIIALQIGTNRMRDNSISTANSEASSSSSRGSGIALEEIWNPNRS